MQTSIIRREPVSIIEKENNLAWGSRSGGHRRIFRQRERFVRGRGTDAILKFRVENSDVRKIIIAKRFVVSSDKFRYSYKSKVCDLTVSYQSHPHVWLATISPTWQRNPETPHLYTCTQFCSTLVHTQVYRTQAFEYGPIRLHHGFDSSFSL